jgi:hypothetical protein
MANEKIQLKIGADTSDLEKAFGNLIKKIQGDADKLKLSPTASKASSNAVQTARDQERNLTREKSLLDMYNRSLDSRKKTLEDIVKLEARGLDQARQRQTAEERVNHAKHIAQVQQATFDRLQESTKRSMGGMASGRNPMPGPSGGGSGFSASDALKGSLGALGIGISAGVIAKAAKDTYSFFASEAANVNVMGGSAVQSNVGYFNQQMLSGDISSQTLIQNQMAKGRELATKKYDRNLFNIFSKHLAEEGEAYGLHKPMESYETKRAAKIGEDSLEQAKASVAKNNSLVLAQGFFQQTFNRNLTAERALGLGSDQFKQMQMQLNNKGFLTDQGTALLSQVQSAGGAASGGQAGNIANLGLGMQRAFNITNSGNALGKLTGLYGTSEQGFGRIDDASKRILEESITKGFNKSENTEIMRRFVETTSGMVYQAEAKKPGDIDRIISDFSRLLSDNPSTKQFEAAQSAFQKYQGMTSQTSGRGGTLAFAAMMRDPNMSKLSVLQRANLMALPEARLSSTNSDIVAAAAQQGIDPEVMMTSLLKDKKAGSLGQVGLSDRQLAPLRKYLGNKDLGSLLGNTEEVKKLKANNPAAFRAYQALQFRADMGGEAGSDEEKKMMMKLLYLGPAGLRTQMGTGRAAAALATGTGGKKEEEYIASQAAQEKQLVLNLKALEGQLYPTAKGIVELTQAIIKLGDAAHILNTGELGSALVKNAPTKTVETKDSLSRTPGNGSKPNSGGSGKW